MPHSSKFGSQPSAATQTPRQLRSPRDGSQPSLGSSAQQRSPEQVSPSVPPQASIGVLLLAPIAKQAHSEVIESVGWHVPRAVEPPTG